MGERLPIFDLIDQGDLAGMQAYLRDHPAAVKAPSASSVSPLFHAVERAVGKFSAPMPNDVIFPIITCLFAHGAMINEYSMLPLRLACESDNGELIAFLLEHGADVNARDITGTTALSGASLTAIPLLIQHGADPAILDQNCGDSPLHTNAYMGNVAALDMFLDHGMNVDIIAPGTLRTPLHVAAFEARLEAVACLIAHGANPSRQDAEGATPRQLAESRLVAKEHGEQIGNSILRTIHADDLQAVIRYLLAAELGEIIPGIYPREKPVAAVVALHDAIEQSDLARVQALLDVNPDLLEALDERQQTPLFHATARTQDYSDDLDKYARAVAVFEALLARGADVNAESTAEREMPICCVLRDHRLMLRLLELGADIHYVGALQMTLLHRVKDAAVARRLLELGADVHAKDFMGKTPLHDEFLSPDMAEVLLAYGADLRTRDDYGHTPLETVRNQQTVAIFLQRGAKVDSRDKEGRTALFGAAQLGDVDQFKLLLTRGADMHSKDNKGYSLLHGIVKGAPRYTGTILLDEYEQRVAGSLEIAKLLLAGGVNVNTQAKDGTTPLHEAARKNWAGIVRLFLEYGANTTRAAANGKTALDITMEYACTEVAALLLAEKCPLIAAVCRGDHRQVQALLDAGNEVNVHDSCGNTPLHWAARLDNDEIITLLLGHGADTNAQNHQRSTPLLIAARWCFPNAAALLLQHGTDVNACDTNYLRVQKFTALHYVAGEVGKSYKDELPPNNAPDSALNQRYYALAELLLSYGAHVNARNALKRTPFHYVQLAEMAAILLRHGADVNARDDKGQTPLGRAEYVAKNVAISDFSALIDVLRTHGGAV